MSFSPQSLRRGVFWHYARLERDDYQLF